MERGTVRSFDRGSGIGFIGRLASADVRFSTDSVIGRDRIGLKSGDSVWFEIDNIRNIHTAINIRKCL